MKKLLLGFLIVVLTLAIAGDAGLAAQSGGAANLAARARALHRRALVVDTHADTPQRMLFEPVFDIGRRNAAGHVDIPRMREGGVGAEFFSIWVPSTYTGPKAVKRALDQIDRVREAVRTHPADLALATAAVEVRRAHQEGKIAVLMGVEGGHMIDDDLSVLRSFAALGVRYMTLTHFLNNNWADSSTDKPAHNGLTQFGKDVVREMNRLGVIVDISHVSDKTFYDALAVTKAPVIASHSSCRAISNHPRNMTDEMIRALAKNGGVIQINYHVDFISQEYLNANRARGVDVSQWGKAIEAQCGESEACKIQMSQKEYRQAVAAGKLPHVSWEKIIEHIDHVVKLVGPDHVGLGSDFDGANMPDGMEDVSKLPRLTEALLRKGYSEKDIEKILGGNTLRVLEQVERVSKEMQAGEEK